jgi:hypothetical protein
VVCHRFLPILKLGPRSSQLPNRSARAWLIVLIGLVLVGLIMAALLLIYRSAFSSPAWYKTEAVIKSSAMTKKAADSLEQRIADLLSGLSSNGKWEIVITQDEMNGWLLEKEADPNFDIAPDIESPRVRIDSDRIEFACRLLRGERPPVVIDLSIDLYMPEENRLAIRIDSLRIGKLPWPLKSILEEISKTADKWKLKIAWRQSDGNPVAVIELPTTIKKHPIRFSTLQLADRQIYLSGQSGLVPDK